MVVSDNGKTTLIVYCVLGVRSGQGKTTLKLCICVLGVVSGRAGIDRAGLLSTKHLIQII